MQEIFDVFISDPILIDEDIYQLWNKGLTISEAFILRNEIIYHKKYTFQEIPDTSNLYGTLGIIPEIVEENEKVLWRDIGDQYRLFDTLEEYLKRNELLRTQLLFQIPIYTMKYMIEHYYSFDSSVLRYLIGGKLTMKLRKDLDILSEQTYIPLRSCMRQFDNLKRVYSMLEERGFQGNILSQLKKEFYFSSALAWKYVCAIFLIYIGFESNSVTAFLTMNDLELYASLMIKYWIPLGNSNDDYIMSNNDGESVKAPKADSLNELSVANESLKTLGTSENKASQSSNPLPEFEFVPRNITDSWPSITAIATELQAEHMQKNSQAVLSNIIIANHLKDIKTHLINDCHEMEKYMQNIMFMIKPYLSPSSFTSFQSTAYYVIQQYLSIGANLCQTKDANTFLDDIITSTARIFKDSFFNCKDIDIFFYAIIKCMETLDAWYLHDEKQRKIYLNEWKAFVGVCRTIIISLYDRL